MAGHSIVVIDDDDQVRDLVRRVLERAGYAVRDAGDGRTGMSLQRREPADLVITDVFMPLQDGIETIQLLREEFPDLPILAVSGGSTVPSEGALNDARMLGADAALPKPFTREDLLTAVRSLIGEP